MGLLQRLKAFFRRTNVDKADGESASSEKPSESSSASASLLYVVIGFDWGTSCTKVVIRDPYGPDSPSYLVDFDSYGYPENPYLLPSRIYVDGGGRVRLGSANSERALSEIKLRLMRHPGEPIPSLPEARPRELAALYIARALRYARQWFRSTYSDRYRQYQIEWQFNLGIPATSHDDRDTCRIFEEIAHVAWGLSLQNENTLEDAREAFRAAERDAFDPGIHEDYVNVVPEVAAQVVGYAKSSLRRKGLHVLVDVGAATLDIAGFIMTEVKGEDKYSVLTAAVHSLGAYRLEQRRINYLKKLGRDAFDSHSGAYEQWAEEMAKRCADPMRNVPSSVREYFPADTRDNIGPLTDGDPDSAFQKECFKALCAVIDDLKKNRDPNSKMWEQGLPIFLAGGGRSIPVYTRALKDLDAFRARSWTAKPFRVSALPPPEGLNAPARRDEDKHRFLVAYGLSYPADDIGRIKPPGQISDINPVVVRPQPFDYQDTKAWM